MSAQETFIPGKDASLEASIATLHARLAAAGFHVEERSWLNEVEGVWSVCVRDRDCPRFHSNGKGSSELAARASALGEFAERLSTNHYWMQLYFGAELAQAEFVHEPGEQWFPVEAETWPEGVLTPELQAFYNPDGAIRAAQLVEFNSGNVARGICALPFERVRDGERVMFPVNVLGNLYVSNGLAAGNTPAEARAQALSEILERHVKFRIIRECLCLPEVPDAVIARFPRIAAGIRALRAAGFGILVKDASLGGEYPVMCVTLLHPQDQGVFASFGAHPRFEVALERALTELLQGRSLQSMQGFAAPGFDREEIADAQNLEIHFVDSSGVIGWEFLRATPDFEFVDWHFSSDTEADYRWLVERIHADGHEIYVADYTHLGVYACRIIVPGMSEIYPAEELEWENSSVGNLVRPALLRLPAVKRKESRQLLDLFIELDLPEELPVATLIGLAADAGSAWEALRVGELKTLLALAAGDEDAALEGCAWINQFGALEESRWRVYRCIEHLLQLDAPGDYAHNLALLFGEESLRQAQALVSGKENFFGLCTLGENMEGSATHGAVLAAYRKLLACKRAMTMRERNELPACIRSV